MANFCPECGTPITGNTNFCTSCGASIAGKSPAKAQWQNKREKVIGKQQSGGKTRTRYYISIACIAVLGGWFYFNLPESGNAVIRALPTVTNAVYYGPAGQQMTNIPANVENGKIVIPLDVLKEKKFIRFTYGDASSGLPLLAYISNEGKIITAISLCEPCNSTTFHIQDDKIICNACGTTWKLNDLEAISGSCGRYPPDALHNVVIGNKIQIDEQLVARWQRRV